MAIEAFIKKDIGAPNSPPRELAVSGWRRWPPESPLDWVATIDRCRGRHDRLWLSGNANKAADDQRPQ